VRACGSNLGDIVFAQIDQGNDRHPDRLVTAVERFDERTSIIHRQSDRPCRFPAATDDTFTRIRLGGAAHRDPSVKGKSNEK
jgi:hypothetical protein